MRFFAGGIPHNTRHDRFAQFQAFVVAVYCYAHAIHTYLRQEPLPYFSNASPFEDEFYFAQQCETRIWILIKM